MMLLRVFLLGACWLLLEGCASFGTFVGQEGEVQFGADADENMRKAEAAMDARNFAEAAAFYEFVKTKYPYLELAKTAELRLGDADFERERFLEARDRYQNFVRLHPTHAKVDYSAFRAALTHYKEIPSDFFLLPPASEKDQVEVRNALGAMTDFVRSYPASELKGEAVKVIDEVKLRLAEHELAIADFYSNPVRARWPAVVGRLENVWKNYSGIGLDEKVAFGLYEAHLKLNEPAKARLALEAFVARFPDAPASKRAQRLAQSVVVPAPAVDAGT